jgi:mannose-6-phosphate isomerase-like protein (cupin superfamily)
VVAELNGQQVRLAKVQGEFVWHQHDDEDEFFLVIEGALEIHMRERVVSLEAGEFFVVPRGVEHKPVSEQGAQLLLFEPVATAHTGGMFCDRTVETFDRI